jgi:hypothetical protein
MLYRLKQAGMCKTISLYVITLLLGSCAVAQQPLAYWSFDDSQYNVDRNGKWKIDVNTYKPQVRQENGLVGKCLTAANANGIIVTNLFSSKAQKTDITIEFLFKGTQFMFTTFPSAEFRINFNYNSLVINTQTKKNGQVRKYGWTIPLKGSGITSYNYLADGNWHHYVFTVQRSGQLQVWIDGSTDPILQKKIDPFDELAITSKDGFKLTGSIDELAFYQTVLEETLIYQHMQEVMNSGAYTFTRNNAIISARKAVAQEAGSKYDEKEFAPGYPNYTVQATDQLKAFPDPRFSDRFMNRNFPWLDITYLHRELPGKGGKGFGKVNPAKAIELTEEMATRWNYYVELPCLRRDSLTANKEYQNKSSLYYALLQYARQHPELPTASVIMHPQVNPKHAGFDRTRPYAMAQDLPDQYYLRDSKNKPIVKDNKKWFSPLAPLDYMKKDALTSAFYLRQLTRHLGRPIDMINENGEIFGHMRPKALLESDPNVKKDIAGKKLTIPQYNGWFQNMLDTCYKNELLRNLDWKNTLFTFYNVSAYNSSYWPSYDMRRTSNSIINGIHYSTPSFYPSRPDNWRIAAGSLNGYGTVAEGRLKEIKMGDKLFAPFVSAGWGLEENNIRPAQWLALLKSMVMLGAEFFHVGYFNVTGSTGWPNGVGPNDPRGYIYQVAMPAYAQAIASRVYPFLINGELLNPQSGLASNTYSFRFKGLRENQLIMVRRLGNKYLIFGSVQPNSNIAGNVPLEEDTRIVVDNMQLAFKIRKQGSMYILDLSNSSPVFYQLDGWHQYEHPYYWSKDIRMEAENADEISAQVRTYTEKTNSGKYDFRDFTTFVRINQNQSISFNVPRKQGNKSCILTIKCANEGSAVISVENGTTAIQKTITGKSWTTLTLGSGEANRLFNQHSGRIRIRVVKGTIDLDQVTF